MYIYFFGNNSGKELEKTKRKHFVQCKRSIFAISLADFFKEEFHINKIRNGQIEVVVLKDFCGGRETKFLLKKSAIFETF